MDAHEHDALIDQELQSALSVEPSPEFAARVRMRIAEQTAKPRWIPSWITGVTVVATSLAVVTALVLWRGEGPTTQIARQPDVTTAPIAVVPSQTTAPPVTTAAAASVRSAARAPVQGAERLEVVFASDERRGVERLVALARESNPGAMMLLSSIKAPEATLAANDSQSTSNQTGGGLLPELPDLSIPELTIKPLDSGTE